MSKYRKKLKLLIEELEERELHLIEKWNDGFESNMILGEIKGLTHAIILLRKELLVEKGVKK